jgi:hypothetical protein
MALGLIARPMIFPGAANGARNVIKRIKIMKSSRLRKLASFSCFHSHTIAWLTFACVVLKKNGENVSGVRF